MDLTNAALAKKFDEFKASVETKLHAMSRALESMKVAVAKTDPYAVKNLQNEGFEIKKTMDFINKEFPGSKTAERCTYC